MHSKQFDNLIVGQGLAGSILAWQLMQTGQRVLIISDESAPSASRVAAGLFNPVTGQRLVLQENAATMIPAARCFYAQLEKHFGRQFFYEKPMLRILNNEKERASFDKRKGDPAFAGYLGSESKTPGQLHTPNGAFEQLQTGYLDTNALLDCLKDYFLAENSFVSAPVHYSELSITGHGLHWQDYSAKRAIFCEGFMAKDNPWFKWLPFQPAKGQIICLNTDADLPDRIINGGKWLMPIHDGSYKTGATYDHDLDNLEPSEAAKSELIAGMQHLLKSPIAFEVVDEKVGVRPNTLDKHPFIGFHPSHNRLGIFNGFGSKGSMLIPFYATAFANHLRDGNPIPAEADISRIKRPRVALTQQVHESLLCHIQPGTIAIDATCGNGFDTLFLAEHVGTSGHVFAFDIQQQAIDKTTTKLDEAGLLDRASLFKAGHENMIELIPASLQGAVDIIMFNLGYLPHADKSVITKQSTTLQALKTAIKLLAPDGCISILAYPGHPGGREETETVKSWSKQLPPGAFEVSIHATKNSSGASPEWIEVISTQS